MNLKAFIDHKNSLKNVCILSLQTHSLNELTKTIDKYLMIKIDSVLRVIIHLFFDGNWIIEKMWLNDRI